MRPCIPLNHAIHPFIDSTAVATSWSLPARPLLLAPSLHASIHSLRAVLSCLTSTTNSRLLRAVRSDPPPVPPPQRRACGWPPPAPPPPRTHCGWGAPLLPPPLLRRPRPCRLRGSGRLLAPPPTPVMALHAPAHCQGGRGGGGGGGGGAPPPAAGQACQSRSRSPTERCCRGCRHHPHPARRQQAPPPRQWPVGPLRASCWQQGPGLSGQERVGGLRGWAWARGAAGRALLARARPGLQPPLRPRLALLQAGGGARGGRWKGWRGWKGWGTTTQASTRSCSTERHTNLPGIPTGGPLAAQCSGTPSAAPHACRQPRPYRLARSLSQPPASLTTPHALLLQDPTPLLPLTLPCRPHHTSCPPSPGPHTPPLTLQRLGQSLVLRQPGAAYVTPRHLPRQSLGRPPCQVPGGPSSALQGGVLGLGLGSGVV